MTALQPSVSCAGRADVVLQPPADRNQGLVPSKPRPSGRGDDLCQTARERPRLVNATVDGPTASAAPSDADPASARLGGGVIEPPSPASEQRWSTWRLPPQPGQVPPFPCCPPRVDLDAMALGSEDRERLRAACLDDYGRARAALERAVGKAAQSYICEADGRDGVLTRLVKDLDRRYLDLYEAYTTILVEDGRPRLPVDAGQLKNWGYNHQEVLDLQEHCARWCELPRDVREALAPLHPSTPAQRDESRRFLDALRQGDEATCAAMASGATAFADAVPAFCQLLSAYRPSMAVMRELLWRLDEYAHLEDPGERHFYVERVARMSRSPYAEPRDALYWELRYRIGGDSGDKRQESGSVGSNPLAIVNTVRGKYDGEDPLAVFRTRMYFVYRSNTLANEIMRDPALVARINEHLERSGKDWRLNTPLIDALRQRNADSPLFEYGRFAAENDRGGLRRLCRSAEIERLRRENPNRTYARAHAAADSPSGHAERYATKLTTAELRAHGFDLYGDARLEPDVQASAQDPVRATETVNDYRARTERLPWTPGALIFEVLWPQHPYADAARALRMPLLSGISGTEDQSTVMAGIVGLHRPEDSMSMRLALIAWMVPADDHSLYEILVASETFGLPCARDVAPHACVYPLDPNFEERVREAQHALGFELPAHYLTADHARRRARELGM